MFCCIVNDLATRIEGKSSNAALFVLGWPKDTIVTLGGGRKKFRLLGWQ
jgi:hypothetical protein